MNVLVTGHNGFIGKELCKKLLKKGHTVVGVDVQEDDNAYFEQHVVDITNMDDLISKVNWDDVDFIYHLAAMANINTARMYPRECYEVNVTGTFNISQICEKYEIQICYISTQCVYGNQDVFPVKEEVNIPKPTEIYGVTKYMGEQLIRMLPEYTILRYGTVVGEGMREALATWIFLDKSIKRKPIPIEGTGNQTRDWIYIGDLVDATSRVIDVPVEANRKTINISGKKSHSVLDMAKMCWKIVNGKDNIKMPIEQKAERFGQIIREDTSKENAKKILSWEPTTRLYDALEKCYKSMIV